MTELPNEIVNSAPVNYDRNILRSIQVHSGFLSAFQTLQIDLLTFIKDRSKGRKLYLCGHSLGGALAVLNFLFLLLQPRPPSIHGIYTLGQPKVGNAALSEFFSNYGQCKIQRVCNRGDIVPFVPPKHPYGFKACGTLVFISGSGDLLYGSSERELKALRLQRIARLKHGVNDHRIWTYVRIPSSRSAVFPKYSHVFLIGNIAKTTFRGAR